MRLAATDHIDGVVQSIWRRKKKKKKSGVVKLSYNVQYAWVCCFLLSHAVIIKQYCDGGFWDSEKRW